MLADPAPGRIGAAFSGGAEKQRCRIVTLTSGAWRICLQLLGHGARPA
jgi:hypothetical protein